MQIIIDTSDNLAAKEADIKQLIRVALGGGYQLTRLSGQFNAAETAEAVEVAQLAQLAVTAPLVGTPPPAGAVAVLPTLPSAQTSSVPTSPVAGASVELDTTGIPWDARIHSKPAAGNPPTKNADGKWKKRKGIDDATFAQVSAQLLAIVSGTAAPAPVAATLPAVELPPVAAPVALPELPPVVALTVPAEVNDFASFTAWVASKVPTCPTLPGLLDQILTHYQLLGTDGAPMLQMLAHRPELVKTFHNWLRVQID